MWRNYCAAVLILFVPLQVSFRAYTRYLTASLNAHFRWMLWMAKLVVTFIDEHAIYSHIIYEIYELSCGRSMIHCRYLFKKQSKRVLQSFYQTRSPNYCASSHPPHPILQISLRICKDLPADKFPSDILWYHVYMQNKFFAALHMS